MVHERCRIRQAGVDHRPAGKLTRCRQPTHPTRWARSCGRTRREFRPVSMLRWTGSSSTGNRVARFRPRWPRPPRRVTCPRLLRGHRRSWSDSAPSGRLRVRTKKRRNKRGDRGAAEILQGVRHHRGARHRGRRLRDRRLHLWRWRGPRRVGRDRRCRDHRSRARRRATAPPPLVNSPSPRNWLCC